jgi:uncharacterized membrane protein YccC
MGSRGAHHGFELMSVAVGQQSWSGAGRAWSTALSAAGPPLMFGIRLWLSVCLALYVAFYLELDNAYWAGTSAAIVCQPQLGASLRKGWFRLIGTLIGAVWIVVLTALVPQDRVVFLGLLAAWGGACAYISTQLKNFASYAAALSGYTAVIIAADTLGATGGSDGHVFLLAVSRATEISIGIVSAGIVLAGTDLGRAPRVLAASIASLAAETTSAFMNVLARAGTEIPDTQRERRELVRRTIALDPMIDQAIGESSELRYHSPVLQTTVHGLFLSIDAWRTVEVHLAQLPSDEARQQVQALLRCLPSGLRSVLESPSDTRWLTDTTRLRQDCAAAVRTLLALPADTPSVRMLADQTAKMLAGILRILDGLALLVGAPGRPLAERKKFHLNVGDPLPAVHNAVRAFLTIAAVSLFWVATAWPNGTQTMLFAAMVVLLLAPRGDMAPKAAVAFSLGAALAAPFAAIIKFAVLPNFETFSAFSLILGLYLVPVGFLVAQRWWTSPALVFMAMAMAFQFVPLLSPANEISYDTVQFYNSALAIIAGSCVAAVAFHLLPPLPPALRARRLLDFALADLRRSAVATQPPTLKELEQRMYGRLADLPDKAEPLQRSQLIAALTVGNEVVQLRRISALLPLDPELNTALSALAEGNSEQAIAQLAALDRRLATFSGREADARLSLRARARILIISEAITQHAPYFDAEVAA